MAYLYTLIIAINLSLSTTITAQPIAAEKLFANTQNSMVQFSPDGKYISYYHHDDKNHIINLVDLKLNEIAARINLGKDVFLNEYLWLNSSQIYISIEGDNENIKNLIGDLNNGEIKLRLISNNGYLVHTLPEQPRNVLFAKRRNYYQYYYDLYIIGIESLLNNDFKNAYKIKHYAFDVTNYFYDYAFKRLITIDYSEKEKTIILKYIPVEGGKWKNLFKLKETDYDLIPVGFINSEKLGVITNKDSDKMVLREFDIKTQTPGEIIYQHPEYDLIDASFLPGGKLDYVKFRQHGLTQTLYFEKGSEQFAKRLSLTFTNQEVYIVDRALNGQIQMLYVNGSDQPGEYFLYDRNRDTASLVLRSYPDLYGFHFSPSELIKFTAKDGTEIEAFLTLPKNIDHSALLVMPHGGPLGVQESDRFNKTVQFYASRGFAVLRVNFRGSSGFGKAFREKGTGEFGRLIEEDITAAVDRVIKKYSFDHICAMGSSYGGYSAAMLAIKHPERYECVIGSFGIYDLPLLFNASNLRATEEYRKQVTNIVGGFSKDLTRYSPVYLSKDMKAPILLIAGRKDDTADFEHSNRFAYVLNKNNHPVEKFFYKTEAHGHSSWKGDMHEAALSYDFFMRRLKLKDPDKTMLDDSGKKALADDYNNIADGYIIGYEREKDEDKAFKYYTKAAQLDLGRANFNVGVCYHSGKGVKKDIDKAVEYYNISAKQNYAKAYIRLGRMYMEGEYYEQDWQKAHTTLIKARELDDSPESSIMLARFYCTAPGGLKNIDSCVELLDIDQYKNRSKADYRDALYESTNAISWIVADGHYTTDELNRIKETINKTLILKNARVTIDVVKEGEFILKKSDKFGENDRYELIDDSFNIKSKDDDNGCFGMIFKVNIPGLNSYKDKAALVAQWVQIKPEGKRKIIKSELLYGFVSNKWHFLIGYEAIKETGTWQLEIYDMDQNKIYNREYHVTPLDTKEE